ncbi:MAG TPA: ion channel [Acidimicrobiia bacterium]|nr:ion channel [Acidimicrobiia bacterium]
MSSQPSGVSDESLAPDVEQVSAGIPIRERYGLMLLLILVGYVLSGVDTSRFVLSLDSILWVTLLLTALWSPGVPKRLRRVGLVATLVVLLTTFSLGLVASESANGWRLLLVGVAQLSALLAILNRISRHERVTLQTVMGGVAAYALIAFVMAAVFHSLQYFTGTDALNGIVDTGDYIYFSFVTLTTVGYGDITPATELAKRLAVVEAFVGQVFLITLVARLVSLWGRPLRSG